jgi:hypothetical protein
MSLRGLLLGLVVLATAGFIVGTTIERNTGEGHHESAATLRAEGKTAGSESKATRASETGGESKATHAAESGGQKTPPSATTGESTATHSAESAAKTTHAAATGGESAATHSAENGGKAAHVAGPIRESKARRSAEAGGEKRGGPGAEKDTATSPSSQTSAAHRASQSKEIGASAAVVQTSRGGIVLHAELKPLGVNVEAVPFVALAVASSIALALSVWIRPRTVLLLLGVAGAMLVFALLDIREVSHQSDEARTGLALLAGAIAALHLAAALVASVMARVATHARPQG